MYDADDRLSSWYGRWESVLYDIVRIGTGTVRHPKGRDLVWEDLLPDEPVLEPAEIFARMTEPWGGWGDCGLVQERFGALLVLCLSLGLQVVPTLFCLGGGANCIEKMNSVRDGLFESLTSAFSDDDTVYVMTTAGWSIWYWPRSTSDTPGRRDWRQYAFSIHWEWDRYADYPECQESCRRKALAVAAFGLALGEFFARWCAAVAATGRSLTEWVPYLECGNEMEGVMRDPLEGGRFHALLAGPIRAEASEMRFRVAELSSWVTPEEGDATGRDAWTEKRLGWLEDVLGLDGATGGLTLATGIPAEVERWRAILELDAGMDMAWMVLSVVAGLYWPPWTGESAVPVAALTVPRDATDLVQQVGFHWYHQDTASGTYEGEARLQSDAGDVAALAERARAAGYQVTWSVGEVGFNAENSPDDSVAPYNDWATPMFQAGELVRRVLLLVTLGAERVCWHSFMSIIAAEDPKTLYQAHGLRNDLGTGTEPDVVFSQEADAWRRPSWLAYRRLVALLSCSDAARLCLNEEGVTVVALESASGFEGADGQRYRFAYVAWMDQETILSFELDFVHPGEGSWAMLSLVPRVTPLEGAAALVDENGFAAGETVEWEWEGWDEVYAVRPGDRSVAFTAILAPLEANPELPEEPGRPAPLCLLTNQPYAGDAVALEGWPFPPATESGSLEATLRDLSGEVRDLAGEAVRRAGDLEAGIAVKEGLEAGVAMAAAMADLSRILGRLGSRGRTLARMTRSLG